MGQPANGFRIFLRNDKKRLYQRMGLFLSLINFFGLMIVLFPKAEVIGLQLAVFATIPVFALYWVYQLKMGSKARNWKKLEYLFALGWLVTPYPWMAAVFLALQFLYQYSVNDLAVMVEQEGITYGNLFARRFTWSELSNVVLKDGLLTLDFKSNKLFQQYLSEEALVNESEFNLYCQQRLTADA